MSQSYGRMTHLLLGTLLVILLASYSLYTAVRYFYSPYQTMTAFSYTVSDSYTGGAVAVRDEALLDGTADGVLSYVCADGEVIIPGMTIAEVYSGEEDLYWQTMMNQYQNEIRLLNEAQSTPEQFLATDVLSSQINEALGLIIDTVHRGQLGKLSDRRDRLSLLMGKHQVATGREKDFSQRISYLQEQYRYAKEQMSQSVQEIRTQTGGYFCSTLDGYETILTTDFERLSTEDYRRAINQTMKPEAVSGIGKVQKGHNWYLAMVVSEQDLARFAPGASVFLDFGLPGCTNIPASINLILQDEESGDGVVVIRTNYISDVLIELRQANLTVRFKSYTGLRISAEALRYQGQTEGVYVKQGALITFKPIERIYTGEDFILCSDATDGEKPLRLFDEVVVEGVDLYDGKII